MLGPGVFVYPLLDYLSLWLSEAAFEIRTVSRVRVEQEDALCELQQVH